MKLNGLTISWQGLTVSLTCNSCATRLEGSGENQTQSIVRAVLSFAAFLTGRQAGCAECRRSIASAVRSDYISSFLTNPERFEKDSATGYVEKFGACLHCRRVLSLIARGICMTCWRKPGVKDLYRPRSRVSKPVWIKEGLPDPRPVVARRQETRRRDIVSSRLTRTANREKMMSLVALLRREIEQVNDELVLLAMQVAEKVSPFRTDEYLGPAWVAIREAYDAGERDQETLLRLGRKGVCQNWNCESDDGVISLTVLKGTTGIEPLAPDIPEEELEFAAL